jgi:hypothetical protein
MGRERLVETPLTFHLKLRQVERPVHWSTFALKILQVQQLRQMLGKLKETRLLAESWSAAAAAVAVLHLLQVDHDVKSARHKFKKTSVQPNRTNL